MCRRVEVGKDWSLIQGTIWYLFTAMILSAPDGSMVKVSQMVSCGGQKYSLVSMFIQEGG